MRESVRNVPVARAGIACLLCLASALALASFDERVRHGYADSNGVNIHYVEVGEGPLVVMIHGFPDFWYSWRAQMQALAGDFRVVAIDQRGYHRSGQPEGVEADAMRNLVADVVAVVRHFGAERATIVAHDWGGAVAWQVAINAPAVVERLVVMNLPHPSGFAREMASNAEQQANSGYARRFQQGSPADPDIFFGMPMTAQILAGWVSDPAAKPRCVQASERSSFAGMLNFYKANYARPGRGKIT
ncbi:MAG: alpha/beta hydrolase [Pseudomonadales bacterium]|nr:alpha/beta hydrolase [Pseudomonadales bacterium]